MFQHHFQRSPVKSSAHFEKRKLGRIVSKLSIVDKLEILEELDDDDGEEVTDNLKTNMWSSLSRKDSGLSSVSTVSTDSSDLLDTRVNKVGSEILFNTNLLTKSSVSALLKNGINTAIILTPKNGNKKCD